MIIFGLAAAMVEAQERMPVLWMDRLGQISIEGRSVSPQFNAGAARIQTRDGIAYNFSGHKSGILFGDQPALKLGSSMTVAVWLFPRSYVNDGPGAQILFRGDDRNGLDPYDLVILGDGTVKFDIENDHGQSMEVRAELPLNKWTHVTASFNDADGELTMWLNGVRTANSHTTRKPFVDLDARFAPGVGVGNVQNDKGPHNQPYNGMLADLRLYSSVLTPPEVGYEGHKNIDPLMASNAFGSAPGLFRTAKRRVFLP